MKVLKALWFHVLLVLPFTVCAQSDGFCTYMVFIKTADIQAAGSYSTISLKLSNRFGKYMQIPDLVAWGGLMGSGHDYFARGNLDIFSGTGSCLNTPVCAITLTSDGSGDQPGWYPKYVDVITTTGTNSSCAQRQLFTIEEWLAVGSPYELTTSRNYCSSYDELCLGVRFCGERLNGA